MLSFNNIIFHVNAALAIKGPTNMDLKPECIPTRELIDPKDYFLQLCRRSDDGSFYDVFVPFFAPHNCISRPRIEY
jgi:hypothetical protein